MELSFAPFIFVIILLLRIFKFSKINNNQQWIRWFRYARFIAVFLILAEIILSASDTVRWIWHIFLISIVLFSIKQVEMRPLRMFLLAFVPYIVVSLLKDLTQVIFKDFYNQRNDYFETALLLSVIWIIAILFSQYRENKAAEKERIKRQKEDEINRAIALRKVELEELVAERTSELTQQKEELEQTLHELRATQDQLIQSEKMASLGQLTAGIAHEIQNPLNFVNNFSEINTELIDEMKQELAAGTEDSLKSAIEIAEDIKQNLEKINHHGKRADAIVKGMLQHSRSSSGIKEPTDINAIADEYLRLSYHGLRAKDKSFNASFKTNFDTNLPKINVIPQDIGRVILNLITNAFYAATLPPAALEIKDPNEIHKPTVIVNTTYLPPSGSKKGACLITVSDNGPGIPPEIVDKIFQPFFTTKPSGQGTGLGLSLSYEIVTKGHGGELKVESKVGEGATFTIVLPV